MSRMLSILVRDQPGTLLRVAAMLARWGFEIQSLTAGATHEEGFFRVTVVIRGDDEVLGQVTKQLDKMVDVVAIQPLQPDSAVCRGFAMLKAVCGDNRGELLRLAQDFKAAVIDISEAAITFEISGDEEKISAFAGSLKPYGILEFVRTGLIGLERRENTIYRYGRGIDYEQAVL